MKMYTPTDAQSEFPKVLQWVKSTPITIQDNNENIAVILDYSDYLDLVEVNHDDWLSSEDRLVDLDSLF